MTELIVTLDISEEDQQLLSKTLNCERAEDLRTSLEHICTAASAEYLDMILGKQLPTRANEIHERRLFHLLKHYFRGRIPSEAEVSALFQVTQSASRTLIRNVRTKFKYDLEEEVKNTVQQILRTAEFMSDEYRIVVQSDNILEELRQTVSLYAPQLGQITKVKNSAGIYSVPEDTFILLAGKYDVELSEIEAASGRG